MMRRLRPARTVELGSLDAPPNPAQHQRPRAGVRQIFPDLATDGCRILATRWSSDN
jgi:hypothetical protein